VTRDQINTSNNTGDTALCCMILLQANQTTESCVKNIMQRTWQKKQNLENYFS